MTVAAVNLWGRQIGAVSVEGPSAIPAFQYTPRFARSGIELSPVQMPLREAPYRFAGLVRDEAFRGLPGLLADALPDRWGEALVDAWLSAQGRDPASFDVVERLCYTGTRAMGALEFQPALDPDAGPASDLQVGALVELAARVLAARERFVAELAADPQEEQMRAILAVGTSAGGARPKAVIAYNEATGQVRSGQIDPGEGFTQWLIKFDGVTGSGDRGLHDPQGWGAMEYAYWVMARACGIDIPEARLLHEGPRRHFMIRRFDRTDGGDKIHMQTIGALEHVSYNVPGVYGYERAATLARRLGLDTPPVEELMRRMIFNVVARNQDDHVKNTAFLMDRGGRWSLAPAYDLVWAHHRGNRWLEAHQMTVNGKRDGFTLEDLRAAGRAAGLIRGRVGRILARVRDVVGDWPRVAIEAGVPEALAERARGTHRLSLPAR